MKKRTACFTALLLTFASAAFAQTSPKPLANDFDVLTKKSIFSRDRYTRNNNNNNGGRNNRFRPPVVQKNYTPIFIGVLLQDDGSFVAFIADPESGQLSTYHITDALPYSAGTIKDLSLDDMTTVTQDKATHKILIGQTVLGGNPEYPAPPAPPTTEVATPAAPVASGAPGVAPPDPNADATAPDGSPPAQPAAAGPSSGGPNGRLPGEDMLTFLKRRRAMQTGGK